LDKKTNKKRKQKEGKEKMRGRHRDGRKKTKEIKEKLKNKFKK
jgi:hypothetical protein